MDGQRSVDAILQQLVSDDKFRESFEEDRGAVLARYDLPAEQRDALLELDVRRLSEAVAVAGPATRDAVIL